jgi:hypothetical protein
LLQTVADVGAEFGAGATDSAARAVTGVGVVALGVAAHDLEFPVSRCMHMDITLVHLPSCIVDLGWYIDPRNTASLYHNCCRLLYFCPLDRTLNRPDRSLQGHTPKYWRDIRFRRKRIDIVDSSLRWHHHIRILG